MYILCTSLTVLAILVLPSSPTLETASLSPPSPPQYGTLTALGQTSTYKIKLANSATATFTGNPVALSTALTLNSGWNWMPYLPQTSGAIASVMPSHVYAGNDLIKSQAQFSTYYEGYGWFGSLTSLEPGVGYMLKVATGGQVRFASTGN